jgi:hypothetical protein
MGRDDDDDYHERPTYGEKYEAERRGRDAANGGSYDSRAYSDSYYKQSAYDEAYQSERTWQEREAMDRELLRPSERFSGYSEGASSKRSSRSPSDDNLALQVLACVTVVVWLGLSFLGIPFLISTFLCVVLFPIFQMITAAILTIFSPKPQRTVIGRPIFIDREDENRKALIDEITQVLKSKKPDLSGAALNTEIQHLATEIEKEYRKAYTIYGDTAGGRRKWIQQRIKSYEPGTRFLR